MDRKARERAMCESILEQPSNDPETTQAQDLLRNIMCEAYAAMHERRYFQGQPLPTNFNKPKADMFDQGLQTLNGILADAQGGLVTATDLAEKMERLSREALVESPPTPDPRSTWPL